MLLTEQHNTSNQPARQARAHTTTHLGVRLQLRVGGMALVAGVCEVLDKRYQQSMCC